MDILVRVDAFQFIDVDKRTLLWRAYYASNHATKTSSRTPTLFTLDLKKFELPEFTITEKEIAFDQIELLGFPLSNPFGLLKEKPTVLSLASHMKDFINKEFAICGYLVTVKNTTTIHKQRMQFGTFLDLHGHWIDTVHFPPAAARFPFRGKGVYLLRGQVSEEFGFITLEVNYMERLAYVQDPRYTVKEVA